MISLELLSFNAQYKISTIECDTHAPSYDFFTDPSKIVILSLKVIRCDGIEWIANFHDGIGGIKYKFLATPSPDVFCAVVMGIGYWINTKQPENYSIIKSCPIVNIYPISEKNIIVFADYNDLCAYDASGFLWKTNDLSSDGIEIIEIRSDNIKVKVWMPPEYKTANVSYSGDVSYDDCI